MKKAILITVALLILSTILYATFRPNLILTDEWVRERTMQPDSRFISWKGNNIHYTDEGQGPVILMIHGFGGSFFNFQGITQLLKKDFRVIRVDIPGMGLSQFHQCSEQPDFFGEYSDFFNHFLTELRLDTIHLMGNSLGGMIAWNLAVQHPEKIRSLVLLNSAGYDIESVLATAAGPLRWKWFSSLLDKGMPEIVTNHCLRHPFADKSKVNPDEYPLTYNLLNKEGTLQTLIALATSGQEPDTSLIAGIHVPTLILWGQEDLIIPVEHAARFQRDIKNSQVKIYSPCGHMPMMELPDSVANDFKRFTGQLPG